ncbi:hypothetical protein ElyMa_005535100 [Elysia marginata]|uniref:Uncharacterized protein n=1 Tax=Elysia marginata TaxID=1093978 RepID=A0AAV4EYR8_9GAST|nr:hypothetical protein ElyMa_005535100 [Elysia marginata]
MPLGPDGPEGVEASMKEMIAEDENDVSHKLTSPSMATSERDNARLKARRATDRNCVIADSLSDTEGLAHLSGLLIQREV